MLITSQELVPYTLSLWEGKKKKTTYITDYKHSAYSPKSKQKIQDKLLPIAPSVPNLLPSCELTHATN